MAGTIIRLKSSDKQIFVVDEAVAFESQAVRNIVEDVGIEDEVPLPNVSGEILDRVIEYCKYHVNARSRQDGPSHPHPCHRTPDGSSSSSSAGPTAQEAVKAWDAEFIKVDQRTLFELILAANYLNIKSLLDLTCQTVANMIKGMTPEQIRKTFNIENDFTPEEEAAVMRENQWAFE